MLPFHNSCIELSIQMQDKTKRGSWKLDHAMSVRWLRSSSHHWVVHLLPWLEHDYPVSPSHTRRHLRASFYTVCAKYAATSEARKHTILVKTSWVHLIEMFQGVQLCACESALWQSLSRWLVFYHYNDPHDWCYECLGNPNTIVYNNIVTILLSSL